MDLAVPGNEIKVAIRVRPLLLKEQVAGVKSRWLCTEKMISPDSSQSSNTSYIFDRVFDESASNKMVYDELASDIVKQAMIGFNGTVFTYGQSGSGKTYTIDALRTFAIKSAYDYIENCPAREFLMRVSYIELYNEKLTDLLSDGSTTLTIREDYDRNVYIDGLKEIIVKSQDHVKDVLTQGNARRTFAETKLNERSSRAHCIFRLVIESREREDPEHSSVYVSYLNLVDLAGSERAGENSGERLREGVSINLSLLTLSQVIRKLSSEQREFINYRDSKLTRILQNALEGNSKTAILCTVAPFSVEETHSTLRFALNAKKVQTKPQQNEVLTDSAMLKKSQLEITKLKNKIKALEERNLVQDDDELQRRRAEREHLIKEFSSFLCVSSKAREEKRGFDKKRRETVCVPQMYRSADFKVPGIPLDVPKLAFSNTLPKQLENISIPGSPSMNDSVFGASHALDSPCSSRECTYCDLSFTDVEQAIVQESILQKYNAKMKKYEAEIADLNRKLRQRSGMFITCRRDIKKNKSFGSEFLNPTFFEEDEEEVLASEEEHVQSANGRLDEVGENMFEEKETLKSQNVLYKQEIEGLRSQLETLTAKISQCDGKREESEKNIAQLNDRIRRDEEEIKKFKAREEEIALQFEEDSKKWKEKIERLEWERSMQEMMKEEKGLLETTILDKNEASERDSHDDLEMQKKELLNEWEEMSRLKEELNEQATSIEKTLCTMEKDKEKLQKERERIDREWNELEKANDDLRKEKEEFDQKQERVESMTDRLLAVQEATNSHLVSDGYRNAEMLENGTFVTSEAEDVLSESHVFSHVDGRNPEYIILQEEKEALLRELDSLKQSVCELNARKCALESEMASSNGSKCEDNVECLPEKADKPDTDRLQKEWEILRKAQEQLKDREIELSEQEAVSERIHDRCCMLEEINERLEEEVQKWRSQCDQGTVNVTVQERNVLSMLNDVAVELQADSAGKTRQVEHEAVELQADSAGKNRQVEHDTDIARHASSLQEEWKKLTKYKAELSTQEENVERKIERLCMLEEEKEQLEEEKDQFYREKESLREAEMDLMMAKEAFKQEQSKLYQELEQDRKGNLVNENQLPQEEENLQEQLKHLKKLQEQFHHEKEAFKQEQLKEYQDREDNMVKRSQLLKDEERLQEQLEHPSELQEQFRQEKEAFEQARAEDQARETLIRDQETLSREWQILQQAQNDFKIEKQALEMSKVNVKRNDVSGREDIGNVDSLKDNLSQLDDESGIVTATSWDCSSLYDEFKEGSKGVSVLIQETVEHKLQENKDEPQLLWENIRQVQEDMNVKMLPEAGGERLVQCLETCEEWHSFGGKQTWQGVTDNMERAEEVTREYGLQYEENYTQNTLDKLQTLHLEMGQLQLEKEQLFNKTVMFQKEKEQFQEVIDMLQRENKVLKGEKEDLEMDKESHLEASLENPHSNILLNIHENKMETLIPNERHGEVQNEWECLKKNENDFGREETLLSDKEESLKEENQRLQKEIENLRQCLECLQQNQVVLVDPEHSLQSAKENMGTQDTKQVVKTGQHDVSVENISLNVHTELRYVAFKEQDLETADLTEQDILDETVRIQTGLSQSGCDISRYIQASCGDEDKAEVCDLMTELKTAGFFIQDKKDTFDEEKESLDEEWEKLRQAQEQLFSKEAALRNLEEDIVQRSDILHKFEAEQRILQENSSHLKQAEDNLGRQQEQLKALEDSIKTELARLLELQKEKEIIQIEIVTLIEDKMVLEKEKGKLVEQQEIDQEKNTDFHCENDIEMTEEEKHILQREKEYVEETKTIIQEHPERCHLKNCIDQGKDTMFVAQKEQLQKEEEQLEMRKAALQIEEERLQKEKEMLEDMKASLQGEADKLKTDKELINEKATVVQEEQARVQREHETLERQKTDLLEEHERLAKEFEERKAKLQKEQETFQHEQEIQEEQAAVLHEEQKSLQKEKESFKERNLAFKEQQERLGKEKDIIEQNIVLVHEQEERLHKEQSILEKKIAAFQKEQEEFQIKAQIFEEKDVALQGMQGRLHKKKEMLEYENITLQSKKERFQKEKELCEEKNILFQEDQRKFQIEKETFQEAIACLQEQQARCQKETELFQEEKEQLQKEKESLQEEKERLLETVSGLHARYQRETKILNERNDRLQEEKDRLQKVNIRLQEETDILQEEKNRLQEAEANFQKKWDNFQMANNDIAKCREQLGEKEHLIENRMKQFEKEQEMFQNELDKLEKAREDLKHEKASLTEGMMHHEEEKRRLQEEWDNFQQSRENLKEDIILFQEKKKDFQEELQSAWDNLKQAQDKVTKEEEALNKKYAEIEEKMQAVLEQERTLNGKESQCVDEIATSSQQGSEELMEELQKLEDELENAYDKIDRLENLITKGKGMLAEKTEAVRQANDRVKELEEAVDALKSNLASLNSTLEAKCNECEKLRKVQDNYRIAVREQEGLKKEMEAMVRGRAKDREYYDDTIRQLKLKLRDTQNAETSFFVPRDQPNQCVPTLDQMRKIVEFENAAKFLELKELKQRVQEHEAKITYLENEKIQLQAEIRKLQLLLDNETMNTETLESTVNQKILANRKVEEELTQLRKQLGKGAIQNTDETPDEVTKMLRNKLQEKDQLIEQLSKSINHMNKRWKVVSLKQKTLIEDNGKLQKLLADRQNEIADSAKFPTQCNVIRGSADGMQNDKQIDMADLLKENSELKACVEKLKLEAQQETVHKENNLKQQLRQPSSSAESLRCVHSELSTQTENNHSAQQAVQTQAFSAPSYRSGGGVESFVIAVKDREIQVLKRKLEKQSETLKQIEQNTHASSQKSVGSEVKKQPEEHRHRRFQVNSTGKENTPFEM